MGVKRIDAERAKELLEEDEEFTYLDVRTPEEYDQGHVPGARNIPFMVRGPHGAGLHRNTEFVSHVKSMFGSAQRGSR